MVVETTAPPCCSFKVGRWVRLQQAEFKTSLRPPRLDLVPAAGRGRGAATRSTGPKPAANV